MNSSTSGRTSGATLDLTSDTTTNVFAERSSWGGSVVPEKWEKWPTTTSTGTSATMGWKLFWEHETKLDEAELEALIATVIDSIIAAPRENPFSGLRAVLDGLSKPLESESSGYLHVPEGAGFAPTVWTGSSTYSPSTSGTTNWYSSTREGTFKTYNWEY